MATKIYTFKKNVEKSGRPASYFGGTFPIKLNCHQNRAWDLGEEKDKEVQKFPLNRGDKKPRRCEQHF